MDEPPILVVHRDIPGEHDAESVDCWCCPTVIEIHPDTTMDEVDAQIERAQRVQ